MRVYIVGLVLFLALAQAAKASKHCKNLRLMSSRNRDEETVTFKDGKNIDTIEIIHQKGNKPCDDGVTFGFDGNTVWADKGCNGIFRVCSPDDAANNQAINKAKKAEREAAKAAKAAEIRAAKQARKEEKAAEIKAAEIKAAKAAKAAEIRAAKQARKEEIAAERAAKAAKKEAENAAEIKAAKATEEAEKEAQREVERAEREAAKALREAEKELDKEERQAKRKAEKAAREAARAKKEAERKAAKATQEAGNKDENHPDWKCKKVVVESTVEKPMAKRVNALKKITKLTITKQMPNTDCTEGVHFGVRNKNVVWVNGDCAGVFSACGMKTKPNELIKQRGDKDDNLQGHKKPSCRSVEVQSWENSREEEPVKSLVQIDSIKLKRNMNKRGTKCVQGDNFGVTKGNVVWVENNCKGKFKVCGPKKDHGPGKTDEWKQRLVNKFGGKDPADVIKKLKDRRKKKNEDSCLCKTWGDPHTDTFDGGLIHFQGTCQYTLVRTLLDITDCPFQVDIHNERRGNNKRVSFVAMVTIRMYGYVISLLMNNELLVNGKKESHFEIEGKFKIFKPSTNQQTFSAEACKLEVSYMDNKLVEIAMSKRYAGHVKGLCGNCNGIQDDDYAMADGTDPGTGPDRDMKIGNSFSSGPGLTGVCPDIDINPPPPECTEDRETEAEDMCSMIKDTDGPFKECLNRIPNIAQNVFEGCSSDVCAFFDKQDMAEKQRCDSLHSFADACWDEGILVDWREASGCAPECPENSIFSMFAPSCQPQCEDLVPEGPCLMNTHEGCQCDADAGYVLQGNQCVNKDKCGCKKGKLYLQLGTSKLSKNCRKALTCTWKNGKAKFVKENLKKCGKHAFCGIEDGERSCSCKRGFEGDGYICKKDQKEQDKIKKQKEKKKKETKDRNDKMSKCTSSGDPHYKLYDGQIIHFQGACTYLLTGTPTQDGECDFQAITKNNHRGGKKRFSFTKALYIRTRGFTIALLPDGVIKVNKMVQFTPFKLQDKGISIVKSGRSVVVITDCGVRASYDGFSSATVEIPKAMAGDMKGICGNGDGIMNDFKTAEGEDLSDDPLKFSKIGNSHAVPNPDKTPEAKDCAQVTPDFTCTDEMLVEASSPPFCGRLTSVIGPFAECLAELEAHAPKEIVVPFKRCRRLPLKSVNSKRKTQKIAMLDRIDEVTIIRTMFGPKFSCVEGVSYGVTKMNKLWVDKGCKAVFQVCFIGEKTLPVPSPFDDVQKIFESCTIDVCAFWDDDLQLKRVMCGANEQLATICESVGVAVIWRTPSFCPMECPANSQYTPLMLGCQPDCTTPVLPSAVAAAEAACTLDDREGCQCDDGFVMDNNQCIYMEDCGCQDANKGYVPRGTSFISPDCTTRYDCVKHDTGSLLVTVDLEHGSCDEYATCELTPDNEPTCVCSDGYMGDGFTCAVKPDPEPPVGPIDPPPRKGDECYCSATGDPHIQPFDGGRLEVFKSCKFTLSKTNVFTNLSHFKIEIKNEIHPNHIDQAFIRMVDIKLITRTIRLLSNNEVKIDGVLTEFATHIYLPEATIEKDDGFVKVTMATGVRVAFDGKEVAKVEVPAYLKPLLSGLCGNCDGQGMDERIINGAELDVFPGGKIAGYNAVAQQYLVEDDSDMPDTSEFCMNSLGWTQ